MNHQEQAQWHVLRQRYLTRGGVGVGVSVGNGVTSHAATFEKAEPDANYAVFVMPSWSTTVRVEAADKTAAGFVVRFGTASGATDTIDYHVVRAEA